MKTLAGLTLIAAAAFTQLSVAADVRNTTARPVSRPRLAVTGRTDANDASLLFAEGQKRLARGQYGTAWVTFHTLLSVYPDSELAPLAREALRRSARLDARNSLTIHSIRFQNLKHVSAREVLDRFQERELALEHPRDLEHARSILAELLQERGDKNLLVESRIRPVAARRVAVVFTVKRAH